MSRRWNEAGQPLMPASYGLVAAEGFQPIDWNWVVERLTAARNYWIATTRPNGTPHVAPVWGLYIDDRVMFATDGNSAKSRNARRNPACSVHLESGDEVVIMNGELERITSEEHLSSFNSAYDEKYSLNPGAGGDNAPVFALNPQTVLAWLESDFPRTATRWTFE